MKQPDGTVILETERLRLRPLGIEDAERITEYAGDIRVAEMTALVPHPYPAGAAEHWIETNEEGEEIVFAMTLRDRNELVGVVGIHPETNGLMAEIGFWVGVPHWGQGYCTEAVCEILRFCFEDLDLQRVYAGHFAGNDASGRVQAKAGMKKEGVLRWGANRFDELKDRVMYGIIRPDWEALQ